MFIKHNNGNIIVLIVYVDDIAMIQNEFGEIIRSKASLAKEFEIKDLSKLQYFLGIEVARSYNGIFISQSKYILDMLKEMGVLGCKPANTPMDPKHSYKVSEICWDLRD